MDDIIPFGGSPSDELITICFLHFLPDDAINDLLDGSSAASGISLLLGNEVLDDFFLDNLLLQVVVNIVKEKLATDTKYLQQIY